MSSNPDYINDPRFRAMLDELRKQSDELKGLREALAPAIFDLNVEELDKSATFIDEKVDCQGATLVQVSTDGDLRDISYKIDKQKPIYMESAESPHIPGPVTTIVITNDTAEAGKTIRISKYRCSPMLAAAIVHGSPTATTVEAGARNFYAEKLDFDGTLNYFETDQPIGTTPTLFMTGAPTNIYLKIHTIKYYMSPANAVTYQLYLLEASSVDNVQQLSDLLFASAAGQAKGTDYIWVAGGSPAKLPIQVKLTEAAKIWYMIDWSAAPGDTLGYIKIYGEVLTG